MSSGDPHPAWASLRGQLRSEPPDGLRALSEDALEDLADAVRGARHRQAAELAGAGEKALNLVPRLLRGPVRRVLSS